MGHDAGHINESRVWHLTLATGVFFYAFGFVTLVNTARNDADAGLLDADRVGLLRVLGALMGLSLRMVVARYQVPAVFSKQLGALLNVALPAPVATWLSANPERCDHTERAPASVIFCDIKAFTSTVELLEPEVLKGPLGRALEVVVEARRARGLIHRQIGRRLGHVLSGRRYRRRHTRGDRVAHGALDGALAVLRRDLSADLAGTTTDPPRDTSAC